MLEDIFKILGLGGFIVICIRAFTIPSNPHEIIPALTYMNFDKPLWLNIIICGSFLYEFILFCIYDSITDRKN